MSKIKITKREESPVTGTGKSSSLGSQKKTRWILLAVIIIPLVTIWLLSSNYDLFNFAGTREGRWLKTPLSIADIELTSEKNRRIDFDRYRGRWMLMYLNNEECTVTCLDSVGKIQAVRMALGKQRTRVAALIVTTTDKEMNPMYQLLRDEFISLRYATISDKSLDKLTQELPAGSRPTAEGRLYLIDPNSEILITYNVTIETERVIKDLKKLLQV